ncbi:MAG: rhodanese-related sulfurtransferase [SAR202 cluster bacterium]|nr:rhodanese-related sulfurtransferase [SAR202 cluster bacterium]MQG43704.1 rhodanese-related sulfurtransferase [SAR202 cluster bacterium]|tara:strand:- start:633 stop:1523 length:891 start_codon:yes stop_codon:yes gene_type:complete
MHKILSFYEFCDLDVDKVTKNKNKIFETSKNNSILGTIILSIEGINGTVSGSSDSIDILNQLMKDLGYKCNIKFSVSEKKPFKRLKVKIQKEIVTFMNLGKSAKNTGTFIAPEDWDDFISNEDVKLIDVRNFYETVIGKFPKSIDPNTETFTDFIDYIDKELSSNKDQKIAMYCTGGIRCEKASSYMKDIGFNNIFQLEGGIINYLNKVEENKGSWDGECFVFDERVSLKYNSEIGNYELCHGCRNPIDEEDKLSIYFEEGVSCPNCINVRSDEQNEKSRQRQAQINFTKNKKNSL